MSNLSDQLKDILVTFSQDISTLLEAIMAENRALKAENEQIRAENQELKQKLERAEARISELESQNPSSSEEMKGPPNTQSSEANENQNNADSPGNISDRIKKHQKKLKGDTLRWKYAFIRACRPVSWKDDGHKDRNQDNNDKSGSRN